MVESFRGKSHGMIRTSAPAINTVAATGSGSGRHVRVFDTTTTNGAWITTGPPPKISLHGSQACSLSPPVQRQRHSSQTQPSGQVVVEGRGPHDLRSKSTSRMGERSTVSSTTGETIATQSSTPPRTKTTSRSTATVSPNVVTSSPGRVGASPTRAAMIPVTHIRCIQTIFGPEANLYRDVMNVPTDATERQIRIAYFRRGRQMLEHAEGDDDENDANHIPYANKRVFEAISMAFEILSTPEWKRTYDKSQHNLNAILLLPRQEEEDAYEEEEGYDDEGIREDEQCEERAVEERTAASSMPVEYRKPSVPPSILRSRTPSPARHLHIRHSMSERSIRWNESVEELLYQQDPDEAKFKRFCPESTEHSLVLQDLLNEEKAQREQESLKKKKKSAVVVDPLGLAHHLANLDKMFQVTSFMETIDTNLEGLEDRFDEIVSYLSNDSSTRVKDQGAKDEMNGKHTNSSPTRNQTKIVSPDDITPKKDNRRVDDIETVASSTNSVRLCFRPEHISKLPTKQLDDNQHHENDHDTIKRDLFQALTAPTPPRKNRSKESNMEDPIKHVLNGGVSPTSVRGASTPTVRTISDHLLSNSPIEPRSVSPLRSQSPLREEVMQSLKFQQVSSFASNADATELSNKIQDIKKSDGQDTARLVANSQDFVDDAFDEDPFAGIDVATSDGSIPDEFNPVAVFLEPRNRDGGIYSIPARDGTISSHDPNELVEQLLHGLSAAHPTTGGAVTQADVAPTMLSSSPLSPNESASTRSFVLPVSSIDVKRIQSGLSASSALTFETPQTEGSLVGTTTVSTKLADPAPHSSRVDTKVDDSNFFSWLSLYMETVKTEMEKFASEATKFGSEVGQQVHEQWEQANKAAMESIETLKHQADSLRQQASSNNSVSSQTRERPRDTSVDSVINGITTTFTF